MPSPTDEIDEALVPVSGLRPTTLTEVSLGMLERALDLATPPIYPGVTELRELVATFGRIHLRLDEVSRWKGAEILEVLHWLRTPRAVRPAVLGRPHVVGDPPDRCLICCGLLGGQAEAFGLERLILGDLVGTDCELPRVAAPRPGKRGTHTPARRRRR